MGMYDHLDSQKRTSPDRNHRHGHFRLYLIMGGRRRGRVRSGSAGLQNSNRSQRSSIPCAVARQKTSLSHFRYLTVQSPRRTTDTPLTSLNVRPVAIGRCKSSVHGGITVIIHV
ncbi:hypothetical protein CPB86DRAFT_596251 [Serendipita vermifera]|nr:hypothetical protein CPB86DRAFT_596251 [Serendipita vermifera]